MNADGLQLKVYSSGLTEVPDEDGSLVTARVETMGTSYPGGLFSTCRIFIERDVMRGWSVKETQRVALYNGLRMVWEGVIAEIGTVVDMVQGNRLECVGQCGALLNATWREVWADQRVSAAAADRRG